jgi:hypothetical protein
MSGRTIRGAIALHAPPQRSVTMRRVDRARAVTDALHADAVREVARGRRVRAALVVVSAMHAEGTPLVARRGARRAIALFVAGGHAPARGQLAAISRRAIGAGVAFHAALQRRIAFGVRGSAVGVARARDARGGGDVAVERCERAIGVRRARALGAFGLRVAAAVGRDRLVESNLPIACGERDRRNERARSPHGRSAMIASASARANPFGHRAR